MVPSNNPNFDAIACLYLSERLSGNLTSFYSEERKKKELAQNKIKYFPVLHMLQIKNKYQLCFYSSLICFV